MSTRDAIAFCELQQQATALAAQMVELGGLVEALAERLAALEAAAAGECTTCAARRAADAERQRRSRQRHVTEADEMPPPIGCSPAVTS